MILGDLDDALTILRETHDMIVERPDTGIPSWVERRGWTRVLDSISPHELLEAERNPARWLAAHAHDPLRDLGSRIIALTSRYEDVSTPALPDPERHVKQRKQHQIEAFCAEAKERFPRARRIVDLGAGHGHLTRALARTLETDALGVDWDAQRIATALGLGGEFVIGDGAGHELGAGDLVVGLHPCGALGDALVQRARNARADVLMVSCCFQKTSAAERIAVSNRAEGWAVPRASLGLANLATESFDGSGSLETKRAGRRTRMALRFALQGRGLQLGPGDEARGVTKERIGRGLRVAADHAFARRGLELPSDDELDDALCNADAAHDRIARYALPRHALARVLELGIVLDRACHLREGGWDVEVRPLFSSRVSPRNLGILARGELSLPSVVG